MGWGNPIAPINIFVITDKKNVNIVLKRLMDIRFLEGHRILISAFGFKLKVCSG